MSCHCDQFQGQQEQGPLDYLPASLMTAGNESLTLFIRGVSVGLQIKAQENAKWQRMSVMLALTFGVIAFVKHMNE